MKKQVLLSLSLLMSSTLFSSETNDKPPPPDSYQINDYARHLNSQLLHGFTWEDTISLIRESHEYLITYYEISPQEVVTSIKLILNHILNISQIPGNMENSTAKEMISPFVELMVLGLPPSTETSDNIDQKAIELHVGKFLTQYQQGFRWNDLAALVGKSISITNGYSKASPRDQSAFAAKLVKCVLEKTSAQNLPYQFSRDTFLSLASSMIDHPIEVVVVDDLPPPTSTLTPEEELQSAQTALEALNELMEAQNYSGMIEPAKNLKATAKTYLASRRQDAIGNSFFSDLDRISTLILNDIQGSNYKDLAFQLIMAQDRINREHWVYELNDEIDEPLDIPTEEPKEKPKDEQPVSLFPEEELHTAQTALDALNELMEAQNYENMVEPAQNLKASAKRYLATRQQDEVGNGFFADMDKISTLILNDLQDQKHQDLAFQLIMAQDRINREHWVYEIEE